MLPKRWRFANGSYGPTRTTRPRPSARWNESFTVQNVRDVKNCSGADLMATISVLYFLMEVVKRGEKREEAISALKVINSMLFELLSEVHRRDSRQIAPWQDIRVAMTALLDSPHNA
jgi:hypothetical protein